MAHKGEVVVHWYWVIFPEGQKVVQEMEAVIRGLDLTGRRWQRFGYAYRIGLDRALSAEALGDLVRETGNVKSSFLAVCEADAMEFGSVSQ